MPTFKDRYYSAPPSTHNVAAQYIFDANAVNTGCLPPLTGVWRPIVPTDFASTINVSGSGFQVNAPSSVAITGNPSVTVSNQIYQVGISGNVGATGSLAAVGSFTLNGDVGITGDVSIAGSTYKPFVSGITSGTINIPKGSISWSVAVESGSCYFNQTLLNAGTSLNGGGYDGRYTLRTAISVGCTGGRTIVMWEL